MTRTLPTAITAAVLTTTLTALGALGALAGGVAHAAPAHAHHAHHGKHGCATAVGIRRVHRGMTLARVERIFHGKPVWSYYPEVENKAYASWKSCSPHGRSVEVVFTQYPREIVKRKESPADMD